MGIFKNILYVVVSRFSLMFPIDYFTFKDFAQNSQNSVAVK